MKFFGVALLLNRYAGCEALWAFTAQMLTAWLWVDVLIFFNFWDYELQF